jgi:hypothetical protein
MREHGNKEKPGSRLSLIMTTGFTVLSNFLERAMVFSDRGRPWVSVGQIRHLTLTAVLLLTV